MLRVYGSMVEGQAFKPRAFDFGLDLIAVLNTEVGSPESYLEVPCTSNVTRECNYNRDTHGEWLPGGDSVDSPVL